MSPSFPTVIRMHCSCVTSEICTRTFPNVEEILHLRILLTVSDLSSGRMLGLILATASALNH